MIKRDKRDPMLLAMVMILILFVLWFLPTIMMAASIQSRCLRAGYLSFRVDYRLNAYCVKRVDQTDVVVPLADVR